MQRDMGGGLCKKLNNFLAIPLFGRELPSMGEEVDVGLDLCPSSLKDWGVEGWGMNKDSHARQRACVLQNS